jgi:hypothetical protein
MLRYVWSGGYPRCLEQEVWVRVLAFVLFFARCGSTEGEVMVSPVLILDS